jgi:hypothetical protein
MRSKSVNKVEMEVECACIGLTFVGPFRRTSLSKSETEIPEIIFVVTASA